MASPVKERFKSIADIKETKVRCERMPISCVVYHKMYRVQSRSTLLTLNLLLNTSTSIHFSSKKSRKMLTNRVGLDNIFLSKSYFKKKKLLKKLLKKLSINVKNSEKLPKVVDGHLNQPKRGMHYKHAWPRNKKMQAYVHVFYMLYIKSITNFASCRRLWLWNCGLLPTIN